MVAASRRSIDCDNVGPRGITAFSVADAGPPAGTPVPATCEVVFTIMPAIVARMIIGTLHDAPAESVTELNEKPLPLKVALPAEQV